MKKLACCLLPLGWAVPFNSLDYSVRHLFVLNRFLPCGGWTWAKCFTNLGLFFPPPTYGRKDIWIRSLFLN